MPDAPSFTQTAAGAARDARGAPGRLRDARGPGCPRSDGAHRPGLYVRPRRGRWSHGARAAAAAPNPDADVTGTRPPSRSTSSSGRRRATRRRRRPCLLNSGAGGGAGRGGVLARTTRTCVLGVMRALPAEQVLIKLKKSGFLEPSQEARQTAITHRKNAR